MQLTWTRFHRAKLTSLKEKCHGAADDVLPTLESYILVEETTEGRHLVANPYFFMVDTVGQQLPYIAETAAAAIRTHQPDFAFIYLGTIDFAGHQYGWMTDAYLEQIEPVDGAIGLALEALTADDTVLLQSDHGGHERTHGTETFADMTIPWMLAGPGIRAGYAIQADVSLLDTAPTLAHVMGVPAVPQWEGACVLEAFQS